MARHLRNAAVLAVLSLAALGLAGNRVAANSIDQLSIMAPAAPGGGWDLQRAQCRKCYRRRAS